MEIIRDFTRLVGNLTEAARYNRDKETKIVAGKTTRYVTWDTSDKYDKHHQIRVQSLSSAHKWQDILVVGTTTDRKTGEKLREWVDIYTLNDTEAHPGCPICGVGYSPDKNGTITSYLLKNMITDEELFSLSDQGMPNLSEIPNKVDVSLMMKLIEQMKEDRESQEVARKLIQEAKIS